MLTQLALISELLTIDHGKYVVRVMAQIEGRSIATGLAAADTVEIAEDRARERAMAVVNLEQLKITPPSPQPAVTLEKVTSSENGHPKEELTEIVEDKIHQDVTQIVPPNDSSQLTEANFQPPEQDSIEPIEPMNDSSVKESPVLEESQLNSEQPPQQPEVSPANLWPEDKFQLTPPEDAAEPQPQPVEAQPEAVKTQTPVPKNVVEFPSPDTPLDFSDIIARTDVEMKRLGWTQAQGRNYLLQTYGKKSRHVLSDQELIEFLSYLESQ